MRKIIKGMEPLELRNWKGGNQRKNTYESLVGEKGFAIRQVIKRTAITEQFGLCAYCCNKIDETNSVNEHVEARRLAPNRQLDFNNIVASCNKKGRCDDAHKSQYLPLTPLMDECETELKFYLSGKADGLTERAKDSILVLGLDEQVIREERKQMVDVLLYQELNDPNDLLLLGDELLTELLEDFKRPDDQGQLPPYSPVLINIIRHFLSTRAV